MLHAIRNAAFTQPLMLIDNHQRPLNYLRLAITDRCNLRCHYCMPEEGIEFLSRSELMTYEEMLRICSIMAEMGIEKIRLTGGEPFLRRDFMYFLRQLVAIPGIREVHLTTNGTLTAPFVPELRTLGIASVNLSIDTLDSSRFAAITRRDVFPAVQETFRALLDYQIPLKTNTVVMAGENEDDIASMAQLAEKYPISVRFIEEMPFNGGATKKHAIHWTAIEAKIFQIYPNLEKIPAAPHATANLYCVPGHPGNLGIIAAYSRTFCGSCNRLRLTPQGMLRTCLYDEGVFNLRDLLRAGATDAELAVAIRQAANSRAHDGFEAEQRRFSGMPATESMTTIGG